MAIAVGSLVCRAKSQSPNVGGVCVGAGAVAGFEVTYADGSKDLNAVAATGIIELIASAPAAGDPLVGSFVTNNHDTLTPGLSNPPEYFATGAAFTLGGVRVWECQKLTPSTGQGPSLPYYLQASISKVVGPVT